MDHNGPVRVDGLTIVGATAVGHAKIDEVEAAFLRQHIFFPEHTCAVHVRWQYILEHVPEMRGKHLYQDLSPLYREIGAGRAGPRLLAAYDLSILQHRFWDVLAQNSLTMPHVHGWQTCAAQAWQRRLLERLENQKPWRRTNYGKIKKPVTSKPPYPDKWYH